MRRLGGDSWALASVSNATARKTWDGNRRNIASLSPCSAVESNRWRGSELEERRAIFSASYGRLLPFPLLANTARNRAPGLVCSVATDPRQDSHHAVGQGDAGPTGGQRRALLYWRGYLMMRYGLACSILFETQHRTNETESFALSRFVSHTHPRGGGAIGAGSGGGSREWGSSGTTCFLCVGDAIERAVVAD